jgi:hypothetical protein
MIALVPLTSSTLVAINRWAPVFAATEARCLSNLRLSRASPFTLKPLEMPFGAMNRWKEVVACKQQRGIPQVERVVLHRVWFLFVSIWAWNTTLQRHSDIFLLSESRTDTSLAEMCGSVEHGRTSPYYYDVIYFSGSCIQ